MTHSSPWRRDFPLLSVRSHGQPLAYLDNAATTQKPRQVIDALGRYYKTTNANVHRGSHDLSNQATQAFEQARQTLAGWLGVADPSTLIWTRGTTEAINLVAQTWGVQNLTRGDLILLMQSAHHANIVPWQMLAERVGARIAVIPLQEDGDLDMATYRQLLEQAPKLVALTQVSNALGTVYPIAQMCQQARVAGATVLVDGAQGLPHFDTHLSELGCDFYAFSGHKLFGPTGIGALWGRRELLESMPPWQGGGEMIAHVSFDHTTYAGLPFKFEAGTPNISGTLGLAAAVGYLQQHDRLAQEAHEQALQTHALECCATVPGFARIPAGERTVSLFSFVLAGHHQQDVAHWLDSRGIAVRAGHHCAMPLMDALGLPGTLRASFAFYNTLGEAERLALALDELVQSERSQISTSVPATASQPQPALDAVYQARDWNQRYQALMALAQSAPGLPAEFKQEHYLVPGCETRAWLVTALDDQGRLACRADADARILRALLVVLLSKINGLTPHEVSTMNLVASLEQLDIRRHLSPSRGNGLLAIIRHIEAFAETPNR